MQINMSQLLYISKTEVGNNGKYGFAHPVGGGLDRAAAPVAPLARLLQTMEG